VLQRAFKDGLSPAASLILCNEANEWMTECEI
jgi:hypothetical protein